MIPFLNAQAIVTRGIRWPNALTLDLVLRKVYWCDSKFHSIYSANFDGSNRRVRYLSCRGWISCIEISECQYEV